MTLVRAALGNYVRSIDTRLGLRVEDLLTGASEALRAGSEYIAELFTPTLRLGVTGLSGAGKTVFITALVRNLVGGGRLPFFSAAAERRLEQAYLEPQPDDAVPRFDYEAHLEALARDPPAWPDSTRRVSELRITLHYRTKSWLTNRLGPVRRLHLDIVDYPGEWLLDLPMLAQNFAAWSGEALARAREPPRAAAAEPFLRFLDALPGAQHAPEALAIEGASLFTTYLRKTRAGECLSVLGPGRFLMPGSYEGSPLLTFFPVEQEAAPAALLTLLKRRYESYQARVVRPFFRDHFSRLDRQIVLVDALTAIDAGPHALLALEQTISAVLAPFRQGAHQWLSAISGRRIDRVLFAASKADHLHHTSHDRLEAILRLVVDRALARAEAAGAHVGVIALAALRATREIDAHSGGDSLPCILGIPLSGEVMGNVRFDGQAEAAIFPGDLPKDPREAFDEDHMPRREDHVRFLRFRPPRLFRDGAEGAAMTWPHIRLDRALEFLLSDRLS